MIPSGFLEWREQETHKYSRRILPWKAFFIRKQNRPILDADVIKSFSLHLASLSSIFRQQNFSFVTYSIR